MNRNYFEKRETKSTVRPVEAGDLQQSLLETLGAAVFICEARARRFPIARISDAFAALTGFTSSQAVGQELSFLYGSRTDAAVVKAVNGALIHGRAFQGELLCYRADGATFWCSLVLVPRAMNEEAPTRVTAALIDISARKKSEQQIQEWEANYRGIFENAVEGIYQSTPEGRYIQVNRALARMYGYRSPEALLKQVCDIGNQIYVDPSMRQQFKTLIHEADQVRGLEYQVRRRDGKAIWISESARMVRDANGRARYYEGFIEEITGRKEAEAALQQSQQRLIETSRQIGLAEMATGLLHNIGNALNSVNVSSSVMSDKLRHSKVNNLAKVMALVRTHESNLAAFLTNDARGREVIGYLRALGEHLVQEKAELQEEIKTVKKTVEHASEIIASQQNSAKAFARVETVKPVDLIEDALRMNANSLARHQVEVVREYVSNLPEVTVPKHQILQILVNLIRNAQKACQASGASVRRLTVSVAVSREGRCIRMEVRDNGVGIPRANLDRIFGHGFTTRKDGHGFGLHSGVLMVKDFGGSLTAHSDGPGRGASFVLEFPREPAAPKLK